MTEDEAKTKWCPAYRVAMGGAGGSSMSGQQWRDLNNRPREGGNCIGSRCMAWVQTDNEGGSSAEGDPEPVYKPAGRCGLAGRP